MAFPLESLPGAPPAGSSRGARALLGRKSRLQPERRGRAAAERAPVDAPEPQQVEEDGEQDHEEAAGEQAVVVHEGEAPPVGVTGPEGLLLDISAHRETKETDQVRGAGRSRPGTADGEQAGRRDEAGAGSAD